MFPFILSSLTSPIQLPRRNGTRLSVSISCNSAWQECASNASCRKTWLHNAPGEVHAKVLRFHTGGYKARFEEKDCWVYDPRGGNWFLNLSFYTFLPKRHKAVRH